MDGEYGSIWTWLPFHIFPEQVSLLVSVSSLFEQGGGQGADQAITTQMNSALVAGYMYWAANPYTYKTVDTIQQ